MSIYFGYGDGLSEIEITERKLFDLLRPRVGKKAAKAMAYSRNRTARWKIQVLLDAMGHSQNLKDIRLMYLFCCTLSARQQVILKDNRQKYKVKRTPA